MLIYNKICVCVSFHLYIFILLAVTMMNHERLRKTFMKENSPINPTSLKLFQQSFLILHLGRLAIGLFRIGSYIVQHGRWTMQFVKSS